MDGCSCHCTASALTLAWDPPLHGQEMIQSTWAWVVYVDMAYMEFVNKNYYVQVYGCRSVATMGMPRVIGLVRSARVF